MPPKPAQRTPRIAALSIDDDRDKLISVLLLAFWTVVVLWQQWGQWAEDLSAVYIAGWLWQSGQGALIYDTPPAFFGGIAESWQPAMAAMGIADESSFAYVYPPIWAVLTAPLTEILSPQGFFNAAALIQIPLLAASVWLAGRLIKPAAMPWWVWTAIGLLTLTLSVQTYLAIRHNQPTITVGFLILLAFERLQYGRPLTAGGALAVAASVKLTPAFLVLIFLLDRQWRAAAYFTTIGAALGLISVGISGWPAHQAFLESLALVKGVAYLIAINTSILPTTLAIGSALGLLPPIDPEATQFVFTAVPRWLSPTIAITALLITIAFGQVLYRLPGDARRAISLFAFSIILALFGPLGWLHYYVLPMLLLPGLLGILPRRTAITLIALVGVPSLTPVFAQIGALPWPVAHYTWLMCTVWLIVLAALFAAASRMPKEPA